MKKERKSKRQLVRDEKRAKKRDRETQGVEEHAAKRQRLDPTAGDVGEDEYMPLDDGEGDVHIPVRAVDTDEREFFGMLSDEEKEYFRHADELLELNDFPSAEERNVFLQNVFKEAEGKELKLASSQSCSRLMERLILLSSTKQKKHLFEAFAGHFLTLITHRFASHCCEKLFVQSAPVVTQELGGVEEEEEEEEVDTKTEGKAQSSMEDLFLLTLDELEEHLTSLLSDRYASHTLRVLLIVLSGRPIDLDSTKTLLQSKKKERVTVQGASALADVTSSQVRAVPSSFTMAIEKIITDTTASMDSISLRVLATHPTGNPVLQLLLELELSSNREVKAKKTKTREIPETQEKTTGGARTETLLERLMPEAPSSFTNPESKATEFVNTMLYDSVGSRLLEVIITHGPGKIFKALYSTFFAPRIQSLLRYEIASYPALRALNRISKDDLVEAVNKCLPEVSTFVERRRYNVLKTLFERCHARNAPEQGEKLLKALTLACGGNWKLLVPKLCLTEEENEEQTADARTRHSQHEEKARAALVAHGSQLALALLSIAGQPSKAVQASLNSLRSDQLFRMATAWTPTGLLLQKAFDAASESPNFHKILAGNLARHTMELARSSKGHHVLNSIISTPCKDEKISVPFHLKENIMTTLAQHEGELRETWMGRNVWRAWRGDWFGTRPADWSYWVKKGGAREAL